ncbi:unnamed protein product [Polarella glacialis]|uniref:THH1/TOM1/TOM3 domain-containing protein n=1 Tax=Polarella glacialis TaxID=89957 RepID=A0A813HW74_POLGL|nr:unnamed protein product [Polarella glacialis]
MPARQEGPETMSIAELHRSRLLAVVDVILFFTTAVIATRYWLETHSRIGALRRRFVSVDSLVVRRLFLQLLSLANVLRAFGLVLDAEFRSIYSRRGDHKLLIAVNRWFDYFISSFPTMVWSSMLSVLLLYVVEIYYRSQLRQRPKLLRPTIAAFNAAAYLIYGAIAVQTLRVAGYSEFRLSVYCLLGCTHVLLVLGLARYGFGLLWQLRQRTQKCATGGGSSSSEVVLWRLSIVFGLLPVTELARTINDFEYSLGGLPFNLGTGVSALLFLAAAKLMLEWVPSVAILYAFRPDQRSLQLTASSQSDSFVDPLLPPDALLQEEM